MNSLVVAFHPVSLCYQHESSVAMYDNLAILVIEVFGKLTKGTEEVMLLNLKIMS
jgi:hypothetical protein